MNMDDSRSKSIAEVLGNETCKKILDYLAENKEKSEEDISKDLNMKLNTVEYNLKKLLDTGLVEKTKNFFWSKRGKKISLYKVAKKHIVISPRSTKPNMNALKTIIPVILIAAVVVVLAILLSQNSTQTTDTSLNKFNSLNELKDFLKQNKINGGREMYAEAGVVGAAQTAKAADATAPSASGSSDYSQTNIQVAGVDEADIIKNDGRYIYTASGNKVIITDAYPAENMKILSEINFTDQVNSIFINGNKLIVFSNQYSPIAYGGMRCMAVGCVVPSNREQKANIYIYDISDRENPELTNNISVSGNYVDSRMIDNYVYVIANQYAYEEGVLPAIENNGDVSVVKAEEIYKPTMPIRDYSFEYTIILAINTNNGETSEKTMLTGDSQTIYVSQNNIYTTYTRYPQWFGAVDQVTEKEKTIINKISINKDQINYIGSGEVPGHLLNQFSMDEYDGNFRVATTISGYVDNKDTSTNNVYVLDENLNLLGKVEEIAPGESIYSVRFMGERAYMVTFKHVDPLYVLDLSDPTNPSILGKLKIPGYSDYLHPYDATHIIGIGKEVDESIDADKVHTEGAVYYTAIQGVKISIFDVSDVSNPIEMYKVVIGDRGTESLATTDHKAFLFDKQKQLLVVPMTVAELKTGQSKSDQGDFTFQGAYVYNINLEEGLTLKGKITHFNDSSAFDKSGYSFYGGNKEILRSLYIDNTLYTFSNSMIKANDLNDLTEIKSVDLPYEEQRYYAYGTTSGAGVAEGVAIK
jgi:uncharacterized secreted protein with C-terminal beta-propeller domain